MYARLLSAADRRHVDTVLLDSALNSRSPALGGAAALAIGQLRATALAGRLRTALHRRDSAVAASAAFALGLLRDSAAVPALAASLDGHPTVGVDAAWALGEIGELSRRVVEGALSRSLRPPVTVALLFAAAKLRPVPVRAITPHLQAEDNAIEAAAAYAIARPRASDGVRALLSRAASAETLTRSYVARGLARSAAGDSLADSAITALTVLAADSNPHVRINALTSLGGYGPRARTPLTAAIGDPDPNVRVAAAASLQGVLPGRRRDWAELWNADTAFTFRRTLVASALRTGVILEAIDEDNPDNWQRSANWRYRAAVAEAAGGTAIERIREVSLPLTRDPDGRVRYAAYAAFAPFLDSADADAHPWRRELVLRALRDDDFSVRAIALSGLTRGARASEVPVVIESYRVAQSDSTNDARVAAVRFLAAAWRNDSARLADPLRRAIAALPSPTDPLVRAAGAGSTLFSRWSAGGEEFPGIEWYEGVVREVVMPALAGRPPAAELVTERGTIVVDLYGADAPLTVYNFMRLSRDGFYRDTRFHRVVPNFVAQDGDRRGDGNGGPGYAIRDELNRRRYYRGVLGMALSGPDTGGSQYFVTHSPQPHLDGHYTAFGHVREGHDVLDRLVQGDRVLEVRVR